VPLLCSALERGPRIFPLRSEYGIRGEDGPATVGFRLGVDLGIQGDNDGVDGVTS